MGIFSKDPAKAEAQQAKQNEQEQAKQAKALAAQAKQHQRAQATEAKSRAKAQKKGIAVDGALAVGHTFDDSADQFLLVFPDRVELINRGKVGSLFRSGAGTETMAMDRITSTEVTNRGIWAVVEVHASGNSVEFKADQILGPYLRHVIQEQVTAHRAASTSDAGPGPVDVTEQLRKLGELHQAGVLTDEEFSAKKADLLDRL